MIHEIKTGHGKVVADFPDDFVHDFEALHEAADYLDREGMATNADTTKVQYLGKDGEYIGSITWKMDEKKDPNFLRRIIDRFKLIFSDFVEALCKDPDS